MLSLGMTCKAQTRVWPCYHQDSMAQLHSRAPSTLYKFRSDFDRDVRTLLGDRRLYLSSPDGVLVQRLFEAGLRAGSPVTTGRYTVLPVFS